MADGIQNEGRISHRGFASMNAERQRQIASMGGDIALFVPQPVVVRLKQKFPGVAGRKNP